MTVKWTPAPWTIATPAMGFSAIHGPNGELIFGLAAGSADEKQPDDVCEANARLIAAAPELYEALKRLLIVAFGEQFSADDERMAKVMASVALRKARSEP